MQPLCRLLKHHPHVLYIAASMHQRKADAISKGSTEEPGHTSDVPVVQEPNTSSTGLTTTRVHASASRRRTPHQATSPRSVIVLSPPENVGRASRSAHVDDLPAFDPLSTHRYFCPWICDGAPQAMAQGGKVKDSYS